MPCQSEYLEPNEREKESRLVCEHLYYLMDKKTPSDVLYAKDNLYGDVTSLDRYTALLCAICGSMSKRDADKYIYDGRNPKARKLADWWEKHQEVDRKRIALERKERELEAIKKRAIKKLTKKEREALGL
jgi:hypothetical protein